MSWVREKNEEGVKGKELNESVDVKGTRGMRKKNDKRNSVDQQTSHALTTSAEPSTLITSSGNRKPDGNRLAIQKMFPK